MKIYCKADDKKTGVVDVFGEIGWDVTSAEFNMKLKALGDIKHIELNVNSPGGSVFEGIAIYNMIKNHPATVTANIIGLSASMGSVIPMSADKVIMSENAVFMIHNPWTQAGGEAKDLRKTAEILDTLKESLITSYVNKSGLSDGQISAMMDDETWLTAKEAYELGFVDEISEALAISASVGKLEIPSKFNKLIEVKNMSKEDIEEIEVIDPVVEVGSAENIVEEVAEVEADEEIELVEDEKEIDVVLDSVTYQEGFDAGRNALRAEIREEIEAEMAVELAEAVKNVSEIVAEVEEIKAEQPKISDLLAQISDLTESKAKLKNGLSAGMKFNAKDEELKDSPDWRATWRKMKAEAKSTSDHKEASQFYNKNKNK